MKLIFVYNADSDFLSQAKNFITKAVDPDSYKCNLCKITYGTVVIKQEWRDFIENSDIDMDFLHKDEFLDKYPGRKDVDFPAVFEKKDGSIKEVITAEEINKMNDVEDLKNKLEELIS